MILAFSTQINKKPTYFVERIHLSFRIQEVNMKAGLDPSIHYPKDYNFIAKSQVAAKIHSIREDKSNRWKAGTKIDFFINCRQKDMFRFAPVLPVVSVQDVFITYAHSDILEISIDDRYIHSYSERLELAKNDGFDTWDDFFNYFYPLIKASEDKCLSLRLIHWTNHRYEK